MPQIFFVDFAWKMQNPPITAYCHSTRLLSTDGSSLSDPTKFRSMVVDFQYLKFTRPNLVFSVYQLCHFMHHLTSTHSDVAKRVLRYVKGTLYHDIHFSHGPLTLSTFTDVDRTRDPSDRRSTIGLLVFLGSNPISWSSKKQTTVSQSSIEVEYRALVTIVAKISWPHIIFK